ncbi:helix-turn-helix transcriptional regulator [Paractinoplanes durhamensis]|uniref:AlpA family phage regulatory protein n=1 Tax=Paractinoplanes durhamensis TaxID=113563 RepID=A0ABQ3Z191_9ACTN|nr:DNA-binding protein [Actinoplanes durhamensis]GIE03596.1 hypothetical protein Adu01nite_49460 [Actinoplanes durhamensis]
MTSERIRIVGAHEIRVRLGGKISRQRVYQITGSSTFPKPIATLEQGKIWAAEDVETWIREHRSEPAAAGRPKTVRAQTRQCTTSLQPKRR